MSPGVFLVALLAFGFSLTPIYMASWAAHNCAILWSLDHAGVNGDAALTGSPSPQGRKRAGVR